MLAKDTYDLEITDERGEHLILQYRLKCDNIVSENKIGIETYGISIAMASKSNAGKKETAEYHDISTDESRISALLKSLFENAVTPMALPYIVEDFLAE